MFSTPEKHEIDHRTIKLIIGLIALTLANITSFFSSTTITSISASYFQEGWARDFFVGFLFAISAFFLSYNGESRKEMLLSKLASTSAFWIAMFPCACDGHKEIIPHLHYIFAAIMFSILALFCWMFHARAKSKGHREAMRRSTIYIVCMLVIIASMLIMFIDFIAQDILSAQIHRLTFYCERAGLIAFGISWLTASRAIPFFASNEERLRPFA